ENMMARTAGASEIGIPFSNHTPFGTCSFEPVCCRFGRLNSTTELQGCSVSVRLLFNPQHWQLPLYQLVIGCWIRKSAFLQYSGMHGEYHLQAIEEKRATSILSGAFSTNGENATNRLAR